MLCNLRCLKVRLRMLCNKLSMVQQSGTSFQDSLTYVTFLFSEWRIAEHASDIAPKSILRPSVHWLQIFLVKYEYLRYLLLCDDQGIREKLKKPVCKHVFVILTTYRETRLNLYMDTCPKTCAYDPYDLYETMHNNCFCLHMQQIFQ